MQSGSNPPIPFTLGVAPSGQNTTDDTRIPLFTTSSTINPVDYQNAVAGFYNSGNINVIVQWDGHQAGSINAILTASGAVINICTVTQPAGTLTFNIDPSVAGTILGSISQDLKIKCTNGDPVSITASSKCGGPAPVLDDAYPACGGVRIPFAFNIRNSVAGMGFGPGTDISLDIGGSVSSVDYANAPEGSYGDLETVTINY